MNFTDVVENVGRLVDAIGIGIIVIGIVLATIDFLRLVLRPREGQDAYKRYRQNVGRALLMGLEFLVAADIIRTVAIAPTLENVAVLGLVVIIRTFLSWTLELELNNRWPWQRPSAP